jgi:thiosulfate/3-mercaptopyruvate sulfurtransferase
MLRWLGHESVAVLDGGIQAWQRAGGALVAADADANRAGGATSRARPWRPLPRSSVARAERRCRRRRRPGTPVALLDARSGERFRGEAEPIDPVAGHIPGALNRFHKENLAEGGGSSRPRSCATSSRQRSPTAHPRR